MDFRMDLDWPQSGYEIIHKWFTRLVVAGIIYTQLKELNLKYPTLSKEK